jgi:hypothetical protein
MKVLMFTILLMIATCLIGQTSPILITEKTQISSFFGTDSVRLVFVDNNDGKCLNIVDFWETTPHVSKIMGTSGVVYPILSPDGRFVVFNTADNISWILLLSGGSPIQIDSPAYEPRFLKSHDSLFVVYTTVNIMIQRNAFLRPEYSTMKKLIVNGQPQGGAILVSTCAYSGGISFDGNYLASGASNSGSGVMLKNLATGDTTRLHQLRGVNRAGRDTIISPQICNTSVSQSRRYTDAMLYRDAGNTSVTVPGFDGFWGADKCIFLSRADGRVHKIYRIPYRNTIGDTGSVSAYYWNGMEWSTHPYFAVTGYEVTRRWKDAGGNWYNPPVKWERITAINLKDSLYLSLVQTQDTSRASTVDMQWPHLWVNIQDNFSEDADWLNNAIAVEKRTFRTSPSCWMVSIRENTLMSDRAIRRVVIDNTLGQTVTTIPGCLRQTINLAVDGQMSVRAAGRYMVTVESIDGMKQILKWTRVH